VIDLYSLEQTLKMEREELNRQHLQRATWMERSPIVAVSPTGGVRRRLALALLALADRLDPRAIVAVAHTPGRPTLNGTLRHA
jgi:hypothetical protein